MLIRFSTFLTLIHVGVIHAYIDNLYCGKEDCYEVLAVSRSADKQEIAKAYRTLAKKWHPDRHKDKTKKIEAAEQFTRIANAYEILKDDDSRRDYDYMIDHPEEYYTNVYRYYKRHVTPKVDVRVVIVVTITVISALQYLSAINNYHQAISYLLSDSKYRMQATQIAQQEGLLNKNKKKDRQKTKEELRQEEDAILKTIIAEKIDLRGAFRKPHWSDVLWIQIILLPIKMCQYINWQCRWFVKFTCLNQPYGDEEKVYLVRRNVGIKIGRWEAMEDHEREDLLEQELWDYSKFVAWKEKKQEELRLKVADSGRAKQYRRFQKKGGPGQIVFGPE